jgi:O-antigen biosynthesis protein
MKLSPYIQNDVRLSVLLSRIMELLSSIERQEAEFREQQVRIAELMKQTTGLIAQNHDLELLKSQKEAYISVMENSCSLRIGRITGKPFILLKSVVSSIARSRAAKKIWTLTGLMIIALEQPVQLLKNINMRNMRTLKAALNREQPDRIRNNFKKLLFRDQQTASKGNKLLHDLNEKRSDEMASGSRKRQVVFRYAPLVTIIVPVYNTPGIYLEKCINSVLSQTYLNWELCVVDDGSSDGHIKPLLENYCKSNSRVKVKFLVNNSGIAGATNEGMNMATGEFVAFVDHDDELVEDALLEIVKLLNDHLEADVIYTDQDYVEANGDTAQHFHKPDWSPELFRGVMYVGHLLVVRRTVALRVGGFDERFNNVQDYEFMLRLSEITSQIFHLPEILYHWRKIPGSVAYGGNEKSNIEPLQARAVNEHLKRCSIPATAYSNPHFAHRVILKPHARKTWPAVRILMHSDAGSDVVAQCIDSLFSLTTYPSYELTLFQRSGMDNPLQAISEKFPVTFVEYENSQVANCAAAENNAAACGSCEYIILLHGSLEVITRDWIEMLLFYAEMPQTGCVGPLILNADGTVFDAGLVLGFDGAIGSIMRGIPADSDGYAGSLSCAREVSAVGEYCMMLSRGLFLQYGGLQKYYSGSYHATDLALRLFKAGRRNIVTPRASMRFHEYRQQAAADPLDAALFIDRWGHLIKRGDPFYNPHFSLIKQGYSLFA